MAKTAQLKSQRNMCLNRLLETQQIAESAQNDASLKSSLKVRSKFLQTYIDNFMEVHIQIINAVKETELEVEDTIRKQADDAFFNISSIVDTLLSPDPLPENGTKGSNVPQSNVKLPKISIPHYDGNFKVWGNFRDLFQTLVHNNSALSNIEKFQYLISSLSKTPLSIVSHLPVTDENYPIAYKALYDRYQNKRLLATSHWREIQKVPTLTSDNPDALRHLLDTLSENLAALKQLGFPVDQWDFILFNLLLDKLDVESRKHFEKEHSTIELPSFDQLKDFLSNLCEALERAKTCSSKASTVKPNKYHLEKPYFSRPKSSLVVSNCDTFNNATHQTCVLCKANHVISKCPEFLKKPPYDRYLVVKDQKMCVNCMGQSHGIKNCQSSFTCRVCRAPHHTLLHFNSKSVENTASVANTAPERSSSTAQVTLVTSESSSDSSPSAPHTVLANTIKNQVTTLLSTAIIQIADAWGNFHNVRALLDSASQVSFMTEKCAHKLALPRLRSIIPIQGVGQISSSACGGIINCNIQSLHQNFSSAIECAILSQICGDMPNVKVDSSDWKYITNLRLADPTFGIPGKIDVLLGADIFPDLLQNGKIVGDVDQPTAINTVFGWILMGSVNAKTNAPPVSLIVSRDLELNLSIKKFWELEEVPTRYLESPSDTLCESIYENSYSRTNSGRYMVPLPFKGPDPVFSNTRALALKRFKNLERRLIQNPTLNNLYSEFMRDYLDSDHMELISNPTVPEKTFYIPHHCIFKPDSSTTKLRVVFDASAKLPDDKSLNDELLTGPKLQLDITTILLNFRLNFIAFTADIKQMYRQILIQPSDRDYQRIVWRFNPNEPIQDYRLNTVTYGVSCAPYLALRTIRQLAKDESNAYPAASKILLTDTYVDDIVSGENSLDQALTLQQQLTDILKKGGFELRKWASNHPALLATLPVDHRQTSLSFDSDSNVGVKILGLQWFPVQDIFSYKVQIRENGICTKRMLLSELARIFDPLGFLAPLTFLAKHLIQRLWSIGLDWDEAPPSNISQQWDRYVSELPHISNIQVPRCIRVENLDSYQLHGFCDASELGYAAVVYIRAVKDNSINISLICAKSKVAPLKRISIPRLELCAAHLLSNLMAFVLECYSTKLPFQKIFAWSDSTIVLTWLNASPHKWKTFVGNRVSDIQEKIPSNAWHHIRSEYNPADCASRGLLPDDLINHPLWWKGPQWLSSPDYSWPQSNIRIPPLDNANVELEERKVTLAATVTFEYFDILLTKYSSLPKLQRIFAYCLRFTHNSKRDSQRNSGAFSAHELHQALLLMVKHVQYSVFIDDINTLKAKRVCSKPLRKLNPFIDDHGLLRVGGRLSYSSLSYDQKHPLLLPSNSRLTELMIEYTHQHHLHPGLKLLQSLLMRQFWIISAKRAIRRCLGNCYRCFRTNPPRLEPFMANLPAVRVNQVKPFSSVGVDYGGPFTITMAKLRGAKSLKAYLCLFVCLTTKAVHLELASDLSTDAFLAALRRFISRRGRCSHIYSDCGTNFVGAQRYLQSCMQQAVEKERIQWHFNPPSAPHFGGIWEAGIKSVKTHLSRVVGDQILTYEELNTLFTLIEAVLNSRPLGEISSDPNDCSPLTPAHFLTMEPLSVIPDPDITEVKVSRLTRWQLIQRFHQDFWKRWHREYLHTLQQRFKWNNHSRSLSPGMIVLVVDDNAPPLQWRLARIENLHPGTDGICRVVSLRTKQGLIQRPVVKICPLPYTD